MLVYLQNKDMTGSGTVVQRGQRIAVTEDEPISHEVYVYYWTIPPSVTEILRAFTGLEADEKWRKKKIKIY